MPLTLLLCAFPALAQDWSGWQSAGWPQWLGPDRNGISPETGLFGGKLSINESWRVQGGKGFSGLSAAGGRLYTMYIHGGDEYAVCLDAGNGEVLWRTRTDGLLMERQGGDGPRATPTVDEGTVFVSSAYGKLYALDSRTGSQKWSRDLVREYGSKRARWGFCPSPLVAGNLVLIEAGGHGRSRSLIAFDKTSGDAAWTTGSDKLGYSSPIAVTIGRTPQAVFFTGYGLVSVAPQDGKVLWQHPWTTRHDVNAATPVFIPPGRFFISSGYGTGGAVVEVSAADSGYSVKEVWRNTEMKNHFATSIYYEGHLYGFRRLDPQVHRRRDRRRKVEEPGLRQGHPDRRRRPPRHPRGTGQSRRGRGHARGLRRKGRLSRSQRPLLDGAHARRRPSLPPRRTGDRLPRPGAGGPVGISV